LNSALGASVITRVKYPWNISWMAAAAAAAAAAAEDWR
jgi:histidinol-phosphate/aromatic aminotransferase/cobyric acid decarboxylase-like protein